MVADIRMPRFHSFGSSISFVLLCTVGFAACEDRTHNEALLFLDRYDRYDSAMPPDEREQAIHDIEVLAFRVPEIQRVQRLCTESMRSLLSSETKSVEARAELQRANGHQQVPDHAAVPREIGARIEQLIEESSSALELARRQVPDCERSIRELRNKHQPVRASSR